MQISKCLEEVAEAVSSLDKYNFWKLEQTKYLHNSSIYLAHEISQGLIDSREGLKDDIGDVVVRMIQAARLAGTDLTECLEQSWGRYQGPQGHHDIRKICKGELTVNDCEHEWEEDSTSIWYQHYKCNKCGKDEVE